MGAGSLTSLTTSKLCTGIESHSAWLHDLTSWAFKYTCQFDIGCLWNCKSWKPLADIDDTNNQMLKFMSEKTKKLLFVISIIVVGISLGIVAYHFFPCKDYMTPLFIVLAIHIYLEDMFKRERLKKQ